MKRGIGVKRYPWVGNPFFPQLVSDDEVTDSDVSEDDYDKKFIENFDNGLNPLKPPSDQFNNPEFADIILCISSDDNTIKLQETLYCHSLLLVQASEVWHRELQAWSTHAPRDEAGRKIIYVNVPPDQVSTCVTMVKFCYTGEIPEDLTHDDMISLLCVADRMEVFPCMNRICILLLRSVLNAKTSEISSITKIIDDGFLHGIRMRHDLDAACTNALRRRFLYKETLNDESTRREFEALNFRDALRVFSADISYRDNYEGFEDMLALMHCWVSANDEDPEVGMGRPMRAFVLKELLNTLSLPLLSTFFVEHVLQEIDWLKEILSPEHLEHVRELRRLAVSGKLKRVENMEMSYPALPGVGTPRKRIASNTSMAFKLSRKELTQYVSSSRALRGGGDQRRLCFTVGTKQRFRGMVCSLAVLIENTTEENGHPETFDLKFEARFGIQPLPMPSEGQPQVEFNASSSYASDRMFADTGGPCTKNGDVYARTLCNIVLLYETWEERLFKFMGVRLHASHDVILIILDHLCIK